MQRFYRIRWVLMIAGGSLILLAANVVINKAPLFFYEGQQRICQSMDWVVKDVVVEGRHRTEVSEILKAIQAQLYTPLLNYSPHVMKEKLEQLPWVHSALIRRDWPHTLYIKLQERQPIAIFQHPGAARDRQLIDQNGRIIPLPLPAGLSTDQFLIVTGEGAAAHVPHLLKLLGKFSAIYERATFAIWIARRWDIILEGRIRLKLPEKHMKEALEFLLTLHRNYNLLDDKVVMIDLRLGDRSYIQFEKEKGIVT